MIIKIEENELAPWDLKPLLNPQPPVLAPGLGRDPQQRFRSFQYEEAAGPREALAQLRELCWQWLWPEARSKEQVLELLVQEQFLVTPPPDTQVWVESQCSKTGEETVVLVEDFAQMLLQKGKPQGLGNASRPGDGGLCRGT